MNLQERMLFARDGILRGEKFILYKQKSRQMFYHSGSQLGVRLPDSREGVHSMVKFLQVIHQFLLYTWTPRAVPSVQLYF